MIDFYRRVEELRADKGLNKKDFSHLLDMQNSNYAGLLKSKKINGDLSNALKKEFGINLNWLISGVGEMYQEDQPTANQDKFISYYETFDTTVEYALVMNEFKKIYNDNPLLSYVFDDREPNDEIILNAFYDSKSTIFDMALIKGLEYKKIAKFVFRNSADIKHYAERLLQKGKCTSLTVIIQNDIEAKSYNAVYCKQAYLGAIYSLQITKENVVIRFLSKNFDNDFDYILDEIEELKEIGKGIKEVENDIKKLKKEYEFLNNFSFEIPFGDLTKLDIVALLTVED